MPSIHVRRDHALGLDRAREVAWKWAEEAEGKFGMECTVIEGETSDVVEFTRSGVHGQLVVAADHFELDAKLGLLIGAFARTIEAEIVRNLDTLLAAPGKRTGGAKAAKKAAKKAAPPKTPRR
ncbi:MAG: polyhydroxyalkanoic acid system family protein [Proteobacteria bacterium]|nr:polyhydroxyalkanoic acid system family protein [Pseudomonadota bacterium]